MDVKLENPRTSKDWEFFHSFPYRTAWFHCISHLSAFDCPACSAVDDAASLKWSLLTHTPVRIGSVHGAGLCYHEWQQWCQSQTCQLGWHQCCDSWCGTRSVRHCHKCVVCVCVCVCFWDDVWCYLNGGWLLRRVGGTDVWVNRKLLDRQD